MRSHGKENTEVRVKKKAEKIERSTDEMYM